MTRGKQEETGTVAAAAAAATPRFEDGLAELEGIVRTLEQGELPLEESLAAFERGMGLVQRLGETLDTVEQRVEVLLTQADGTLRLRPLEEDDE